MKITKKITSIVLALLLAVSAFAGLAITANAADPTGTFTLHITKYDVKGTGNNGSLVNDTDSKLTGTESDAPTTGNKLAGVTFTMLKVAGWNAAAPSLDQAAAAFTAATEGKIVSEPTDANGETTLSTNVAGIYYVVETASPASVTDPRAGFLVSLPMTSVADGKTQQNDVYVYPKNLTTLGASKMTKTVNTKDYDATKIKVAPVFKLYAGRDATGEAIAVFTLATAEAAASASVVTNNTKYSTVTVGAKDGVMAVDGLPTDDNGVTASYSWVEESGITLIENDTKLPVDSTPRTFTVVKNQSSTIVTNSAAANFGVYTYGSENAQHNFNMDNSTEPTVAKAVDKDNASIGEIVTWTITPVVPADIDTYQVYKVTDDIDSRLDISGADAVTVKLDGTEVTTGFTKSVSERKVTVDFAGGFAALKGKALTIEIQTSINSTAVADEAIPNKAILEYKNKFQTESKTTESNEPTTTTGAFKIVKVDASDANKKLEGVEFTLSDAQGNALTVTGTAGSYTICKAGTEGATSTVVTDANGEIYVKGLAYSKDENPYKLTETKTKNGYQLLTTPVSISVYNGSGNTAVVVQNVKQPDLPLTGGVGTVLFYIAGIALIGGGAFFFLRSRKAKREEI